MRIFITLILSALMLFAYTKADHLKIQIIETIITNISIDKEIKVWCDDALIQKELVEHQKLKVADSCESATIVILKNKNNLPKECEDKHIFALSYKILSDMQQSFGALFWKKGRPNIIILEPRIEKQNIKTSKDLEPYLEERLW